jgi:hypothetical protein
LYILWPLWSSQRVPENKIQRHVYILYITIPMIFSEYIITKTSCAYVSKLGQSNCTR